MKRLFLTLLLIILIPSGSDLLLAQWVMWEQTNGPEGGYIQSIAEDDLYVYAATWGPIFRRQKNETTWTPLSRSAHSLAVCGTTLIAGTDGGGVFISTNNGSNWAPVNTGLEVLNVNCLAAKGTYILAGTALDRVFFSENNGSKWIPVEMGLRTLPILSLDISDTYLFAGIRGAGGFIKTRKCLLLK